MRRKILDYHPWETAGWFTGGVKQCMKCYEPLSKEIRPLWCSGCNQILQVEEKISIMENYYEEMKNSYERTIKRLHEKLEKIKSAVSS